MEIPTSILNAYSQVHIVNMLLAQMIERRHIDCEDQERLGELISRLELALEELAKPVIC